MDLREFDLQKDERPDYDLWTPKNLPLNRHLTQAEFSIRFWMTLGVIFLGGCLAMMIWYIV